MQALTHLNDSNIKFVFTDIDDTITHNGKLPANSYKALWELSQKGFLVIPITGRPAGWCEMIARFWPVYAVIGENGGFYFKYDKKMKRVFQQKESEIKKNRKKLNTLQKEILKKVKGSAVSSDQFCRIFDLAIDFCEDVKPLSQDKIQKIVEIFEKKGATAKVSSIHVNGWFGKFDKLSMCAKLMKSEFKIDIKKDNSMCVFVGDSPNDEPMFEFFKNSIAVKNIEKFLSQLKHKPNFITQNESSEGFCEVSRILCGNKTP
jgi:HAD superfamily hydrolase (TIGR01484 family)